MPRKVRGEVLAVVGAQYGSEGKGVIVSHIAGDYDVHVRTGGPNAGHSYMYRNTRMKNQIIPVGWVNPTAELIIGRGMLLDIELFLEELRTLALIDSTIYNRLYVDPLCGVLGQRHHNEEGGVRGEMHARIGSTGEGVGAARMARISRDPKRFRLVQDVVDLYELPNGDSLWTIIMDNTPDFLRNAREQGGNILLEGTQGAGLSLIHGRWPYVTSTDTNAAQLAADAGIPPQHVTNVLLVARTYPIRVAGNSGPLRDELTWEQMSERVGYQVEEKTTVTKKTRRIGEWDEQLLDQAILLNDPTYMAITFMDYLSPADEGVQDWGTLSATATQFVGYVEQRFGVPVKYIGTGGERWEVITAL